MHVTFCLCLSIQILTTDTQKVMNLLNQLLLHWSNSKQVFVWLTAVLYRVCTTCVGNADKPTFLSLTFGDVCSHLLAFLNALLKFQACQMPAPASLLSICQSQACTPHLPPAESQVHWPWHLFHTAPLPLLHWDYKSQVEDHNFVPLLWMNYCILKLLDVEFCHTASRCRLDPPLP